MLGSAVGLARERAGARCEAGAGLRPAACPGVVVEVEFTGESMTEFILYHSAMAIRPTEGLARHLCVLGMVPGTEACSPRRPAIATPEVPSSGRTVMKEGIDAARRFRADAIDFHEIGQRGALDCLERAKMQKKRALARRPDPGDLLQARFAQIALATRPVRADRKAMRLVAQPLDEIKHRIARRQFERVPARYKEGLPSGVALGPLGDGGDRKRKAEASQDLACGGELALPAVDQDEIRPGRVLLLFCIRDLFPPPGRVRQGGSCRIPLAIRLRRIGLPLKGGGTKITAFVGFN